MIDFHSHVLPGIDDGSSSIEESLALLRLQAQQGVTCAVATPHFYPRHQSMESFLHRREEAEAALRQAMAGETGLPQLTVGAEVHFFPGIGSTEELSQLTIGSGKYILIEMPHGKWSDRMFRDLEDISAKQELVPVIAHVDRYLGAFTDGGIPGRLMDAGCLIQANASFFLAGITAPLAMRLLRREQIHLLGSDCHDLYQRPPRIGQAVERIRGKLGPGTLSQLESWGQTVLFGK